ncbi:hypothetical protein [Streptomyces sp. JNUCC 63]
MPTPAPTAFHRCAATLLTAAGLTVLDADSTGTGVRIRPATRSPRHILIVPVVNGNEDCPPPLPQHDPRRSMWTRLMQTSRDALTAADWTRHGETPTGGEFIPPPHAQPVTFYPVIVSNHPRPLAPGIDPTAVRIARAGHLRHGDRVVGTFPTATLRSLEAAARDSQATVVGRGEFASRPFTARTPTTDDLGFVTLTPGLYSVPAGLPLLYVPAGPAA